MKLKQILKSGLVMTLLLTGCSANADDKGNPKEITVITSIDENNPDAGKLNEQFASDMSEALGGIKVNIMESGDYTAMIEGMAAGNVDASLVSPMSYYQAVEKADAEMIAMAKMADEYKTVFITKADNDEINSLEDLKGKSFAFVDQASSSGYLIDTLGLDADKLETSGYFFSSVAFSGQHPTSVMGVEMGDYDAAAVAGSIISMMEKGGQIEKGSLKIIGETDEIPSPCYVVRGDLSQDLKDSIQKFLLSYDNEDFFKAAMGDGSMRFAEPDPSAYESTKTVLKIAGADLGE